ncbi:MAG: glycosyltransferase family 39 protein [Phycisphaerae bacterium]|nr:glycosyltransferase family 39 protein [Phycisphaerae bacterium]
MEPSRTHHAARGLLGALALVGVVTLARLAYLAFVSPYTLAEDEAHYWEWSRRLEWSYYSKGPGVAWAIAASTWAARGLGLALSEFWVRVPAVVSSAALLAALAVLGSRVDRDGGARRAVLAGLFVPAFFIAGLLMTIDSPLLACWAWAIVFAHDAMRRGGRWAWVGLGVAIGLGFLFKYTILLLVPGLVLYAVGGRAGLRLADGWRRWLLAGLVVAALGLVPVLIWNAGHGWVTVRHLLGHLGLPGGDMPPTQGSGGWRYSPTWTLELVGGQVGLIGPLVAIMAWASWRVWRARRTEAGDADAMLLVWSALPIFGFYLVVSVVAEPESNWPIAGFVGLVPLAARGAGIGGPRWVRRVWRAAVVVVVVMVVLGARADLVVESSIMRAVRAPLAGLGLVEADRPLVPVQRITGARTMAADADRLVRELRGETGLEPFVVAKHYGRASLLAFYMEGRPTVYCASGKGPGRRTQYDLWRETSLEDAGLLGRPAVLVGGDWEAWTWAFDRVREVGPLRGETKRNRMTYVGYAYRFWDRYP